MAYDEQLAARVRTALAGQAGVSERKMFGGLSFMLNGNMCCGVVGDDLMVRVGPAAYEDALQLRGARPMDFTGRPMKGMVYIGPDGCEGRGLRTWLQRGVAFASSLPGK